MLRITFSRFRMAQRKSILKPSTCLTVGLSQIFVTATASQTHLGTCLTLGLPEFHTKMMVWKIVCFSVFGSSPRKMRRSNSWKNPDFRNHASNTWST